MRERIILAPGLNGDELIKNSALRGVNCFNTRIVNGVGLARLALMRSGIVIDEEFLGSKEEVAFVAEALKDSAYFGKATYSDICNVAYAIKTMRSLVVDENEADVLKETLSKGVFSDKNSAILDAYEKYMALLADKNYIDTIMLIRKAVSECLSMDSEFILFDEYLLSPVEMSLLMKLSDGVYRSISLKEFYTAPDNNLKINSYKNCYGAPNEVEMIIADIYKDKKIDECTVAVTDPSTYSQLFYDYSLLYGIPVTFGTGVPIINSNPAKLLYLYNKWMTDGYFGSFSIREMLVSPSFDLGKLKEQFHDQPEGFKWNEFFDVLGQIRLTNNATVNSNRLSDYKDSDTNYYDIYFPYLEVMARELALDAGAFIERYSCVRNPLDEAAVRTIIDELSIMGSIDVDQSLSDIISSILKINVMRQNSAPGKLHITTINNAITTIRDNLYIAGMSALKYPGSAKEDYLLLDADLELFGSAAMRFTSTERINTKKKRLMTLVRLASNLGVNINVSYAGLNVSELKKENESSLIYELYKEEHGGDITSEQLKEQIIKVDYFAPALSVSRLVGKAYSEGKFVMADIPEVVEASWPEQTLAREYSPSALEKYFSCPKAFFFNYILNIKQPDDDNPFDVISASAEGTLAHSLMETLANSSVTQEEFLDVCGKAFDDYIKAHPPVITDKIENKKMQFLEMMETAYEGDPHREVVLKEEDIHCTHSSGVLLHGFPDRVEKLDDGTHLIVDFKTGGHLKHREYDAASCLQVLVYAYLMEQNGYKVSGCEYRYIRLGQTVKCDYNDDTKTVLSNLLMDFKGHMLGGDFGRYFDNLDPEEKTDDPCTYCAYALICGKGVGE